MWLGNLLKLLNTFMTVLGGSPKTSSMAKIDVGTFFLFIQRSPVGGQLHLAPRSPVDDVP